MFSYFKQLPEYNKVLGDIQQVCSSNLHRAVYKRNHSSIKCLLLEGADVNDQSVGMTPLHVATARGDYAATMMLLEHGADVNARDAYDMTPLAFAVQAGCVKSVEELLRWGADPNYCYLYELSLSYGNIWYNGLHYSCYKNDYEMVKILLDYQIDVNEVDSRNITALHIASCYGYLEVAKILLERGARISDKAATCYEEYHHSALITTVINDHQNVFRLLLQYGGDLNDKDETDASFLHIAIQNENTNFAVILIEEFGANVDAIDKFGETPLHLAVKRDNLQIVRLLVERGCNVNVKSKDGNAALHLAVGSNCIGIFRLLLSHDADVDIYNADYETPLHLAVRCGSEGTIAELIHHGANIDKINTYFRTPLEIAQSFRHNKKYSTWMLLIFAYEKRKTNCLSNSMDDKVLREMKKYIVKKEIAGLKVSAKELEFASDQVVFRKECAAEIERLKRIRFGDERSLYDFLMINTRRAHILYAMNSNFCQAFERNVNMHTFPCYYSMLRYKYNYGKIYAREYEASVDGFQCITDWSLSVFEIDEILKCMNMREITNFIRSIPKVVKKAVV